MRHLLTLGILVFGIVAAVPARADHCRVIHRGGYVAPVVVKKKAAIIHDYKYDHGHQVYPLYGRSYLESYDSSYKAERLQQQQLNVELFKSINLLQQQLQLQIQRLSGGQSQQFDPSKKAEIVPQMPKAEPQSRIAQIFTAKCAACHTQGSEKGGLALLDASGNLLKVECKQALKVLQDCYTGRMPKNGAKVTDQEYADLQKDLEKIIK